MRLRAMLASPPVLSLILVWALPVLAGQLPPCVKAVSSVNANSLVIGNVQLEPVQGVQGIARRIHQFSFEVFPREKFINAEDRTTARATFWADGSWAQWGIVLDSRDNANWTFTKSCPLPLVTDDGEFLILLASVPAMSADWVVLRIYRSDRTGQEIPGHGRLIREIPLKEIRSPLRLTWPPGAPEESASDETPEWYAGGTFSFSLDNRSLIHKTQWGNTIRISLENGSVSIP
jgi:hypothetical protein